VIQEQWLRREVLEALKMVAPETDTDALKPACSFRDQLGIDSIDYLNFIIGLENRFGVRIAEADYPKLSSLQGCLDYLRQILRAVERSAPLIAIFYIFQLVVAGGASPL